MFSIAKNSILLSLALVCLCTASKHDRCNRERLLDADTDQRELKCPNERNPATEFDDSFDLINDANLLQGALIGCTDSNIRIIIDILTHRNFDQRWKIADYLKSEFNIDLVAEFKKLSGYVKYLLIALMRQLPDFNANNFYNKWIPLLASKSKMLITILSRLSETQIRIIEKAYRQLKVNIEYEIIDQLQKRLEQNEEEFVDDSLLHETQAKKHGATHRYHLEDFLDIATTLGRALYASKPNMKTIISILTRHSHEQILEIAKSFKAEYDKSLVMALDENLKCLPGSVLITLVKLGSDFNKMWLPYTDMPNVISDILITPSINEVETINNAFRLLYSINEYVLQSLLRYGLLDDNSLVGINVLLEENHVRTPVLNCNRYPGIFAQILHNAQNNRLEDTMIKIFTSCSRKQRYAIAATYKELYDTELTDFLRSELREYPLYLVITPLLQPTQHDSAHVENQLFNILENRLWKGNKLYRIVTFKDNALSVIQELTDGKVVTVKATEIVVEDEDAPEDDCSTKGPEIDVPFTKTYTPAMEEYLSEN